MIDNYFFEIPIYRCTKNEHQNNLKTLRKKIEEDCKKNKKFGDDIFNDCVETIFQFLTYSYSYNEVIGWINLYIEGSQIRGDYFFECQKRSSYPKKRYNKGIRTKQFNFFGEIIQLNFNLNRDSNEDIFNKLLSALKDLNLKHKILNKRVLDLEKIENVGPHINWRKLIFELNPYNQP